MYVRRDRKNVFLDVCVKGVQVPVSKEGGKKEERRGDWEVYIL